MSRHQPVILLVVAAGAVGCAHPVPLAAPPLSAGLAERRAFVEANTPVALVGSPVPSIGGDGAPASTFAVLPDGRLLRDPQVLRAVVNDDSATARAIDRAAELQAVADVGGNAGLVAATAGLAVMLTPLLLLDGNRGPDDPLIVGLYLGGLGAALAGVAALGAIAPAATEAAQLRASALVLAPRDMAAHLQVPTSDKEPAPDAPRSIPFP